MTCDRCGDPLAWDDRHECVEVGETHHLACIALCPPCQSAYADDAAAEMERDR